MPFSDLLPVVPSGDAWLPAIDAIAKATVILVVAAFASFALRRASAAARHLVWTLALTSAVVLPALSLALPRWQLGLVKLESAPPAIAADQTFRSDATDRSGAPFNSDTTDKSGATGSIAGSVPEAAPTGQKVGPITEVVTPSLPRLSWPAALLLLWAFGAAVVLGRLALGLIAVQWMSRRTADVSDAPWIPLARRLAEQLGVSRRIVFLRSDRAAMPMAWGVFLPSVLMPADADTWPAERLRIVLLHELAHVKRRDCLTHVIAQIACALYWFNPLAWVAARHVRTERERACDDLVLASGTRGADYADQLLEIARVMRAGRFPAVLAGATLAMAHRSHLEGRLMAILDPTVRRSGLSRLRTAAATAVFAGALLPLASMQPWAYVAEAAPADAPAAAQAPAPRPSPGPIPSPTREIVREVRESVGESVRDSVGRGISEGIAEGVTGGITNAIVAPTVAAVIDSMSYAFAQDKQKDIKQVTKDSKKEQPRREVDPRTVAALTAALKDTDKEVRETALLALVRLRDPNVFDPLVQALGDASPDMREQAAFGLGQLKDPRAVGPLTNALKDENPSVREQAAFALGQIRDKSAVGALAAAMKDQDEDVREQAVFALGQLRDPAAIDGLVVALKDSKANVREQAAFALGQIRDGRAVDPLMFALKDADPEVREQAAFALSQIRDPRAIEALTAALKDENPSVRRQAAFALSQLIR